LSAFRQTYRDFFLGGEELGLLGDAFKFASLSNEVTVLAFQHVLLVHDLGDVVSKHLRLVTTSVVLQSTQVFQFINHLE
jgi:hypothetical protein